ncbi:Rare lipoprotein A precursor [Oxalobacteraceae bacterium IMCC9480]|nr:Rare lipoprotein A precursor [Oxalobacteraceae bacterium IMCC9480]
MTSGSALTIDMPTPPPPATPAAAPAVFTPVPASAPAPAPAATAGAPGFYLQLGAFSQAPNAEAARMRAQREVPDAPSAEVVQSGAVYRLYSGPFTSRTDAASAAQKIQDAGGLKPFIVQR